MSVSSLFNSFNVPPFPFIKTWHCVNEVLQVFLGVGELVVDLLGAVRGLDEGLVVGERQLLGAHLNNN